MSASVALISALGRESVNYSRLSQTHPLASHKSCWLSRTHLDPHSAHANALMRWRHTFFWRAADIRLSQPVRPGRPPASRLPSVLSFLPSSRTSPLPDASGPTAVLTSGGVSHPLVAQRSTFPLFYCCFFFFAISFYQMAINFVTHCPVSDQPRLRLRGVGGAQGSMPQTERSKAWPNNLDPGLPRESLTLLAPPFNRNRASVFFPPSS